MFNKKINKLARQSDMKMINLYEAFTNSDETELPELTSEAKSKFIESVRRFNEYGKIIKRGSEMQSALSEIKDIVGMAEQMTLKETDKWFDNVTVSRHIKNLKESYKSFEKTANEMAQLQQRLENSYNDIGTILERYYDIDDPTITESRKRSIHESVDKVVEKIKGLLTKHLSDGGKLIGFGKVLTSSGIKNSFSSEPIPCIIAKVGGKNYGILNKKYADGNDNEIVGDYAIGIL